MAPSSGVLTFLFTDIEGSSRLWEQDPVAMRSALARHDTLLCDAIERHGGCVFKKWGDQVCGVFGVGPSAIAAAVEAQQALQCDASPTVGPLRVRMALHSGHAEEHEGDYLGPPVNRVARLLSAAYGGQVLLSGVTRELARHALPADVELRDLGEHRLRDLAGPEHVFQILHPSLPDDFPPLRSLEALIHNLPIQLTSFIGRDREVEEAKQLIDVTRLLTLTGAGGCGKSRLALQVAADILHRYPDGACFVELAAVPDAAVVPSSVASALGTREDPGRRIVAALIDHLQHKSFLLILDNCEHLVSACAELADMLLRACAGLTILTTSREPLAVGGETVFHVPSLAVPAAARPPSAAAVAQSEAGRLFAERATGVLPGFAVTDENAPAIAEVCRRLDGIPLAIELAAARLRVLSPQEIASRLNDRFRLLTAGSRSALPHHQTLQATMDWSHDLLTLAQQCLFRRLAVFAGGWALDAAESVCTGGQVDAPEVLDLLSALVEKSLVVRDVGPRAATRYRLLETVRQYARERLDAEGESVAVRERHAEYYLALAERAGLSGSDQEIWLGRLEAEHDNLREALYTALSTGATDVPLRLATALYPFWEMHGHFEEGHRWLQQALATCRTAPPATRAQALLAAGTMAWSQGDYAHSKELNEEALSLFQAEGDEQGMALALNHVAVNCVNLGDVSQGRLLYDQSLALARKTGNQRTVVYALINMGELARLQRQYEQATSHHEEALAVSRALGDRWLAAHPLYYLGSTAWREGDNVRAKSLYRESLTIRRDLVEKRGISMCLIGLAGVAVALGDAPRGARLLGAAEALQDEIGHRIEPTDRPDYDSVVALLQAAMAPEALAAELAAGRVLSLGEAIACALEEAH